MAGRDEASFITQETHSTYAEPGPEDAPSERAWFNLFTRVAVALEDANATSWLTDGTPCAPEDVSRARAELLIAAGRP